MVYFFLFLFGLCVGSFLNLVIDRLPKGEQILKGRSHCDSCRHPLFWYDLIPVLSWLMLRGKCRYCSSPVPFRNVVVELITGFLFVLTFVHQGLPGGGNFFSAPTSILNSIEVIGKLFIFSSLIALFFIDLKHQIIPDGIIYPAIGLTIFFHLFHLRGVPQAQHHLGGVLLAGLGAAAFFLFLILITKGRGMGGGDVKLAFLMGLILGFPKILIALYFAFLTGAGIGVILILMGKKRMKSSIPFGPFLVSGTFFSLFWGGKFIEMGLKMF